MSKSTTQFIRKALFSVLASLSGVAILACAFHAGCENDETAKMGARQDEGVKKVFFCGALHPVDNQILGCNEACAFEFSKIEQFHDLRRLNLRDSDAKDLKPLQGLRRLESLRLTGTRVADLRPLESLSNITSLRLGYTAIQDISPLGHLPILEELGVEGTAISDFSVLGRMGNLRILNLAYTSIVDLSVLAGLKKLETLNISETRVQDLTPLHSTKSLKELVAIRSRWDDRTPMENVIHVMRHVLEDGASTSVPIAREQFAALQRANPGLRIFVRFPANGKNDYLFTLDDKKRD